MIRRDVRPATALSRTTSSEVKHADPQVQGSFVAEQLAVANVKWLVRDEQADDLPSVTLTMLWLSSGSPYPVSA
jgi:hypothetical protein